MNMKFKCLTYSLLAFMLATFLPKANLKAQVAIGAKAEIVPMVIKSKSLGEIKIGMPISEFLNLTKDQDVKKEQISLEGDDYDIYNVYKNGEIIYSVEPDGENVWRIWVRGGNIKTEKGLKIGSTLKEIKENYSIKDFAVGEGNVAILLDGYEYSFILESIKIPEGWWLDQRLETLSDSLKIESIII